MKRKLYGKLICTLTKAVANGFHEIHCMNKNIRLSGTK